MYSFRAVLDEKNIARSLKTRNPETAARQAFLYAMQHGGNDAKHFQVRLYRDCKLAAASAGYGWHVMDKTLPTTAFYN